jgi:hypothetical protein
MRSPSGFSRKTSDGQDNRAARRAAASNRKRVERSLLRFNRTAQAGHGALETYIVTMADYLGMIAAGGDSAAKAVTDAINMWSREAIKREAHNPAAQFICLDCDTTFGPGSSTPAAFAVTLAFADRRHAIVTGIRKTCADKGEDLHQMTLRRLREIWPGACSLGKPGVA